MPTFSQIQLCFDDGYSEQERKAVTLGSRSLLNFVERRLVNLKFKTKISKLNIDCRKTPHTLEFTTYREPKSLGTVFVHHDESDFISSDSRFYETCSDVVRKGIIIASEHIQLPSHQIMDWIDEFKEKNYENRWIHCDKTWKRTGIRSIILCHLDRTHFTLFQSVLKNETELSRTQIAKTMASEWFFVSLLGALKLKEGKITYSKGSNIISVFDLEKRFFKHIITIGTWDVSEIK